MKNRFLGRCAFLFLPLLLAGWVLPGENPSTPSTPMEPKTKVRQVDGDAWPQWRGPDRDGISKERDWASVGKENNLWESEVGLGYSSVVVQDGRLFTMGYDRDAGLDLVWCLDALSGEEVWVHTYDAEIWDQAHEGGTVNTPSIDGDVLFALNREGNLFCLETATGEERWHRDLKAEHELTYPTWGFSASPLIVGDEMILNLGRVLSIDKSNGDLKWITDDYGHAYATAIAFEHKGKPALAVFNGNSLAVLDGEDGTEVYDYAYSNAPRGVSAATPILIEDALFVSSYRVGGSKLLAFGEKELEVVWENKNMTNQLSGCVLMDDHLYGFDESILKCIDTNGEERWSERGIGNGAVTGAADRLLAMSSRGELIVAEATPEKYAELSRTKLFDTESGVHWTMPVLVDGLIYCRSSRGQIVCRDHRIED